jgi:hypothetical protein
MKKKLEVGKTYLGAFDAREGWAWTLSVPEEGETLWIKSWAVRTMPKGDPDPDRHDMTTESKAWLMENGTLETKTKAYDSAQFDTLEELVERLSGLPLLPVGYEGKKRRSTSKKILEQMKGDVETDMEDMDKGSEY